MAELSIIIPTYNERENICEVISRVCKSLEGIAEYEVIVVDDDSPDGTWEVALECGKKYGKVKVIRRVGERGLSSAIMRGIKEAEGDIVAVIDADLQHPPELLPKLYLKLKGEEADIAIASRYVEGGGIEGWSLFRRMISRGAILVGKILEPKLRSIRDPVSGYFMLKRSVVEDTKLDLVGYKFLVEVLVKGRYKKVVELPYVFKPRRAGKSKLGIAEIWRYLYLLLKVSEYRMVKFSIVGTLGIGVNEGLLYLLVEKFNVPIPYASPLAIWASIISNFTLNEFWTFKSKRVRGLYNTILRLVKYHAATFLGALTNYIVLLTLSAINVYYLLANLIGILFGFLVNYALSEHFVWVRSGD